MQVGIDLIGPLPTTSNGNKYMVTLVDYFSKWPEASPLPDKSGLVLPCFSLSCFASEKFNVYTCAPSRLSICSLYSCAYNDLLCMLCITVCNNFLIHLCTYPHRFGFCEVVISDQGREFVNQVETELLGLTGTQHRIATAYHPQTNGLTERFNQTLQSALVNDTQSDWDYHLPAILFAYRTSIQKATKFSPFELMPCQ